MKYMGSKSRVAKYIVPIIQSYIDGIGRDKCTYIEPMVGGANIIDKIRAYNRIGCDINPYLIALLQHVSNDGALLPEVNKAQYDFARDYYYHLENLNNDNHLQQLSDWIIGDIGFLASYNGRFFDGGYAKPGYDKGKYRDYYQEAKANLEAQAPHLKDILFGWYDYKDIPIIKENAINTVIYMDPPYQGTKQYNYSKKFDYEEFWNCMREWSQMGYTVLISELAAPDDFECIWEHEVSRSIKAKDKSKATEKLFKYKG